MGLQLPIEKECRPANRNPGRAALSDGNIRVLSRKSKESLCFIEGICQLGSALRGSSAVRRWSRWPVEDYRRHDVLDQNRALRPRADRSRAWRRRESPGVVDNGGPARCPALCRAQLPGG